jgi:MSHA type pilus biogenesis protein MshL
MRKKPLWLVRKLKYSLFFVIVVFLWGCTAPGGKKPISDKAGYQGATGGTATDTSRAEQPFSPVFKSISPLDSKVVSISVVQEDYHNVLFYLAREAGLNLVIDREAEQAIPPEQRLITAELQNFTLRQAIDAITELLDVGYTIRDGVLRIQATREEVFNLGFILTLRSSKFNLGGDVLGGGTKGGGGTTSSGTTTTEISNPLSGLFELSGETTKEGNDIYSFIEKSLKEGLLSKDGTFLIDRFTGTLMVKDRPRNIRNIRTLIENLRARYSKQVIIEARIVEVALNKSHEFGVQWQTVLNEEIGKKPTVSSVTNLFWGTGDEAKALVAHVTAAPYFDAILRMIENYGTVNIISNPKIRAMHGQPALISAGTSIAYIKSIKRETTVTAGTETRETTVDTSAIFDGLVFGVIPYVDQDGSIILHLVPIKSDVVALTEKTIENNTITLPTVNLRETSTVVKVRPEDTVIIGGIILDKRKESNSRVPILGRIPGIGALFGQKTDSREKVELIILLRARAMA